MATDQQLLSESRNLLNLITNEVSIPRCREYVEEFIEKYETWPSLAMVISSLSSRREDDKKRLSILEKKALNEIQQAYDQLIKKYKHKGIDIPQGIIDDYEQKNISSAGYTTSRFVAVRDLLFLLQAKGELSAIKKFVILSPKGDIYACIFSPSYLEWHQERDAVRKSAWYCCDQIIYLKNNPSSLLFIEDYPLQNNDLSDLGALVQKAGALMLLLDPQDTMKKYKLCAKTLHEYAVSALLGKEKRPDSYDKKTGILVRNAIEIPFKPAQLRGKILTLLYSKSKQRTTAIHFDTIYDKAIKSKADPFWDDLDKTKREKIKKQIFEIYEGINDRVVKKTKKPFLIANDLSLHFA